MSGCEENGCYCSCSNFEKLELRRVNVFPWNFLESRPQFMTSWIPGTISSAWFTSQCATCRKQQHWSCCQSGMLSRMHGSSFHSSVAFQLGKPGPANCSCRVRTASSYPRIDLQRPFEISLRWLHSCVSIRSKHIQIENRGIEFVELNMRCSGLTCMGRNRAKID